MCAICSAVKEVMQASAAYPCAGAIQTATCELQVSILLMPA